MRFPIFRFLVMALTATSTLMAITTDEVLELHKAGVDTKSIVNMIRVSGPDGKPSVQELIKLKKEKVPDEIIQAYTEQAGSNPLPGSKELNPPVKVEGPTLVIEDKISIAEYQKLQAQANSFTRSVELNDVSNNYSGLSEGAILRYLLTKREDKTTFPDDLILAYVSIDGRYSREFYQRVKNNEFELNREKPGIIQRMTHLANTNNADQVTYQDKINIGEYDFTKKQFTPDFFNVLKRGYIQVAGVQYPIVIENKDQWFTTLPLEEGDAKMRLNIYPDRRVPGRWSFTIKSVSKELGVVLHAENLSLQRDLNGNENFWVFDAKYAGPFPETSHPEFPDNAYKNMGDYKNPNNSPSNVRIFLKGSNDEIKVTTFHNRLPEDETNFFFSLPNEQKKPFLASRSKEKFYKMPFENGKPRYVPCSKEDWVYIAEPKNDFKGFKFKKDKLNIAIVTIEKGFLKSKVETKMVYLDESQRETFENGTLEQIERL